MLPLAEKRLVCGDAVRAQEEDCQAARPVVVIQVAVPFQDFEKSEGSVCDGGEPIWLRRQLIPTHMRSPTPWNEVRFTKHNPNQSVVAPKAVRGISELSFQLRSTRSRHTRNNGALCVEPSSFTGCPSVPEAWIVNDPGSEERLACEGTPLSESVEPGRNVLAQPS